MKKVQQLTPFRLDEVPGNFDQLRRWLMNFKTNFDLSQDKMSKVATDLKYFVVPNYSNDSRNAIDPNELQKGELIFNTDLGKLQVWTGAAWETITSM